MKGSFAVLAISTSLLSSKSLAEDENGSHCNAFTQDPHSNLLFESHIRVQSAPKLAAWMKFTPDEDEEVTNNVSIYTENKDEAKEDEVLTSLLAWLKCDASLVHATKVYQITSQSHSALFYTVFDGKGEVLVRGGYFDLRAPFVCTEKQ